MRRCWESEIAVDGLESKTEYSVRVCPIRLCQDGEIPGTYSPLKTFLTPSNQAQNLSTIDSQQNASSQVKKKRRNNFEFCSIWRDGNSSALGGETVVARAGILIPSLYRFLLLDCFFFFLFLFSILWRVPCGFSCRFPLSFVDGEEDAETSEGSASCLHHHRRFHPHCHYNRRSDG